MEDWDDDVDAPLLDALSKRTLVFVRTQEHHSIVTEHEGRRVLVACTDRRLLATWWVEHNGPGSEPPSVVELPLRQLVGLWAAPDVDLLVDPGPGGGVLVPIGGARRYLGLGPVIAGGDGTEPLPFTGFTGGRDGVRVPLMLLVACVVLFFIAVGSGAWWLLLAAVVGCFAAVTLGQRSFGELRQARQATRRLARSEQLRKRQEPDI